MPVTGNLQRSLTEETADLLSTMVNKTKPFVRNGLPPVILKTAQCFYKNRSAVRECDSDEFIKIEKPKNTKIHANAGYDKKRGSASHLLEYPQNDYNNVSP